MQPITLNQTMAVVLLALPTVALAHDGHGNTPLHGIIHMLEANGAWIGLALLVGMGSLIYRAVNIRRQPDAILRKQGRRDDSR